MPNEIANGLTRAQLLNFVEGEVGLIDDGLLYEWFDLFDKECLYWVPICDGDEPGQEASLICDNAIALEERVYHVMETPFPAQSPRSKTLHFVTNLRWEQVGGEIRITCYQLISEVRSGDFTQTGLGVVRQMPARVEYRLVQSGNNFRIKAKIIRLLASELPLGNLTFIL